MANPLDINKEFGELKKFNEELAKTAALTGELLSDSKKITTELGKTKGLADQNKKRNEVETQQLKIQQEQNKLLLVEQKLVDASIKQKALEEKALQEVIKKETLHIKKIEQLKKTRQQAIKTQTQAVNLKIKEKKETERLAKAQERLNKPIKKSGGLFRSTTKSILAASGAMLSMRAAFTVLKNSIKTIATFEQAMSKVKAVTGALPKDFKMMSADAKRLGSITAKSATQVAGLQLEFAKLGFSTAEILNATEATISLSIAAGSDLAQSAVVAASTIRGFGLNASETQRVVDVMAKSFSSSALDLEKFKTAMATVAPVAKASGKDIEFTTAQLSILADSGLDASTAGTSLRNMFLELNKRGLTWEEGLEKINKSTNKNVTALDLFGKRGATAALILADNTKKAQALEVAYDGAAGSAKEMADIMEDNLIGDVTKLSSAWEGFILGLNKGEGTISNVFRGLVKWLTAVVNMFNMANKSYEDLIDQAKNDTLKDFIKGDADEVAFLTEKLGDYNKAVDLVIKSLEEYNANWLTTEEHDVIEARIFALRSLKNETKELNTAEEESTDKAIKRDKQTINSKLDYLEKYKTISDFIRKETEERLGDEIESEEDLTNRILSELQKRVAAEFAAQQLITDNNEKAQEERKIARDAFISSSKELGNVLFDLGQSQRDRELEGVRSNYAAQIAAAEGNNELQEKLAKDLAREEARIQRQQAQSEKNQALFNVAVGTAQNIIQAFPNPFLIALAASLGIAQTGAILAKPLPEIPGFFKGIEAAPAGLKWVAEKGSELINMPDGRSFLAEGKQLINTGGGEEILNHSDTTKALNSAIYNDIALNGNEGIENRLDGIASKLGSLKQLNVNFDADGMSIQAVKGNSTINYLNSIGKA